MIQAWFYEYNRYDINLFTCYDINLFFINFFSITYNKVYQKHLGTQKGIAHRSCVDVEVMTNPKGVYKFMCIFSAKTDHMFNQKNIVLG